MNLKLWAPMASLALVGILTGCGTSTTATPLGSASGGSKSSDSTWMSYNSASKTIHLKLEASYKNVNGGMNFDGYSNGTMQITVPQGWKVSVTFKNDNLSLSHSTMFVPYTQRTNTNFSSSNVAFSGATTTNPSIGTIDTTPKTFSFIADRVGKYSIVCGVPGHAAMGMWDTFIVSDSANAPSVTTK